MVTVKHKFADYKIDPSCEILMIGTFNPACAGNPVEIFYGRSRNYLWTLLPMVFSEPSLKQAAAEIKRAFLRFHRIDFVDLIAEINVDRENDYSDRYISNAITKAWDIASEIESLRALKAAFFTRKTFSDVPRIRQLAGNAVAQLTKKRVAIDYLPTPARFINQAKQREWNETFARAGLIPRLPGDALGRA